MHRFRARSKSDASKRSVNEAPPPTMPPKLDLPPAEDFRTSLIMPSLSRRFTLLRGQNGEPLSIDDVRSRLAQQRANGHVNHVTEEEEQVMIDALIRAHSIDPTASSDSDGYTTATANDGYSTSHTNDYSFESPRYAYPAKAVVKHQPALSTSSIVSKSEPKDAAIAFDTFLSNSTFSPAQIRRASLALQEAIQEFDEDEDDEQILAPRKVETQEHDHAESPVRFGEAIAWPNDQSPPGQDASSSASVPYNPSSPGYTKMDTVNRVPGYVPGMHRPITPRDSAVGTDTTGTSTPQPASTPNEYGSTVSSPGRSERGLPQSILLNKRASTTNSPLRIRPRELSDAQYDSASDSTQTPLKSALSDRRRPTSPLVDSAYQSAIRAGTPSNNFADAWSPTAISFASSPSSRNVSSSSVVRANHLRDTSSASNGADSNDSFYSSRPQSRSAASPESPTINGSSGLANIVSAWNGASTNVIVDEPVHRTSTPRLSVLENGAQRGVRSYSPHARAGTPNTHTRRGNHSRSGSLATDARSSAPRQNPLMMSPMLNSSRSSLASTGSSYHSWDEDQLGGKKPHKRGVSVFIDSDSAPWKKRRSGCDFDFEENTPAPDEMRDVLAGLTVQDMLAVQDRLVSAAVKKRVSMPGRPLSGQRKRRASAGQSMTSMASPVEPGVASPPRIASPPPVAQTPPPALAAALQPPSTPPSSKSAEDQAKKANALLHAMMDSIESSPHKHTPSPAPVAEPINPQAQALASQPSFSSEEPQSTTPPSPADEPQTPDTPIPEQDPRQKALADALFGSDSDATVKDSHFTFGRSQSLRAFAMPPVTSEPMVDKEPSPALETSGNENRSLAEDVERRAMAATAALKSASTPRLHETNGAATNGRKAGKRFNTRQISSPQLVSATTSVDTIAIAAAAAAANGNQQPPHTQSKLSQRFKKLTGNLRTRAPIPTGDEISPFVMETSTPPAAEPTPASPRAFPSLEPPKSAPIASLESSAPATPTYDDSPSSVPGTPTSGQPRLRGLMARLRKGRKDSTDTRDKAPRAPSPLNPNGQAKPIPPPPHIPAAMLKPSPITMPENMSTSSLAPSGSGIEAAPPPPPPPPVEPEISHVVSHLPAPSQQVDEDALRQLYDAASQLGLDKSAINDILVRSQSTSSRSTAWTHASTLVAPSTTDRSIAPPLPPVVTLDRSMSMTTPKAARGSASLGRQLSLKPYTGILPLRTAIATSDDNPTPTQTQASVIRRTVIFPSPAGRISSDMSRRPSMSKHRRTRSGSIHSNKSVSERAPTPPPSRAPAIKRFSKELFPPVPQLPSGVEGTLQVSRSGSAFGNASNYDSLYDMYAEGGQDSTLEGGSAEQAPVGSAVEVLELSDGQIVWSVVDGLRAAGEDYEGDDASPFPRMSRASEYSTPETHELRFREHQRSASKSSVTSTTSKPPKPSPSNRPETRVYFSSAGDIGTLIDSLTKGSDAGQFNIVPGLPTIPTNFGSLRPQSGAQSARSFNTSYNSSLPDGDWTLEERIDQMIAANHKRAAL